MPSVEKDADAIVVETADTVHQVKSEPVAEAKVRHEFAQTEYATPQEKRQAATELADVNSARSVGSFAQVHATDEPRVHIADEARVAELQDEQAKALEDLQGSAPVNSPAAAKQDEQAAKARDTAASKDAAKSSK